MADDHYKSLEQESEARNEKSCCGIKLKKNFTYANLFALFYITFVLISANAYVNVQSVYLLRSPDYFNVEHEVIGRVTSKLMFVSTLLALISVAIAGYLYDIFGRKPLIVIYFIAVAGGLFWLPRTAPNVPALVTVRAAIQMFLATILSHPLMVDYVKQESRGRAIAIGSLGVISGELFGMAVLF